jgi:hypothetical protein
MRQSYYEITEHWTIEEVFDANTVIDAIEGAQARARRASERKAG